MTTWTGFICFQCLDQNAKISPLFYWLDEETGRVLSIRCSRHHIKSNLGLSEKTTKYRNNTMDTNPAFKTFISLDRFSDPYLHKGEK